MAKGSGNPAGKRPSSRNAQPYDASNSFVKRVANKAKDLIPQSSWISGFGKWFNTSQGNEDTLESRENTEETELEDDVQQPPPSKRSCIRMDVIHPPGTFSIQSRVKTTLKTVDSSKEQYPVHNEVTEDFMEPAIAGPSGIGRLISSTPAVQADIRTVTSHRSDLNSLASSTNNGIANGMDDNSELSESTSGCSSLIPQINRHEGPSNLLYSSFSNRKRHIDDKLTYTDHLQTSRSLLLDINSRDTLSSRRPSFNASVVANALDRASPLSSPFYSGNTTFGGANAAGLYKRGRNVFNNSSELQLKVPGRTNVEVKSPNSTVDSSGMSQTAKKILEALEHFSSPITDAKKIPLKNTNNIVSSTVSRKRTRAQVLEDGLDRTNPSARIGLRHLTRELTVPTVPDILKLKRRQKLQDTTLAARRIVSARSDPPPSPQEYRLRTEDNDGEKYRGKLKGKSKINLEQEETVALVNLPNIPLPITTLPNFNFTIPPPASHVAGKTTANKENTFTFASPIKVTDSGKNLQPVNNFTFSNPINAEDNVINMIDSNSPSKTENTESTAPAATMFMPNFIWSGSSTAPRLKTKIKNSKDEFVGCEETFKLKSGSVMDILCPKSDKMEFDLVEQSNSGLVSEKSSTDKIASTFVISDIKSTRDAESSWECSKCLIRNSNADEQCTACKIVRSNSNDKTSSPSTSTTETVKSKPLANDCFGSQFKLSKDQWECTTCCVRNKQSDAKCVACSTPKRQLRTEDSDGEKYHGKLKGKSKINLEQEETATLVNLPNIPLPITTLPSFNFGIPPPASHTAGKIAANKENTFSFASPIKVTDSGKNLQSDDYEPLNNPINTEDNVNMIDSNSPSKTENTESTAPAATMFMPNFIWSGSSTAPRLKAKVKNSKDESEEASKLKSGSVMDILSPKSNKMDSNFVEQSNSASERSSTDKIASTFISSDTRDAESSWECSECLIRNSNADEQCTACKIVRSNPNDKTSLPSTSTTETVVKSKPVANDCFGSQFKLSKDQWECTTCCVRNKQSDAKCVACSTPKPGSSSATPQNIKFQNSDLMDKFKPAEGSWECSGCLLRNAANVLTCPCCNASKPTSLKTNLKKTDFATESSAQKLSTGTKDTTIQETMPPFIFGIPKQETKLPGFNSSAQTPAVNPVPAFGTPSNSATPLFGSSSTPAFGNTTVPAFGDTATTPAIFTFGSTSSQQPSSGGFNFSADTDPPASSAKPQAIKSQNTDLMEKFKPAEGSWECSGCMLRNAANILACPCCDTVKPTSLKTNPKKTDFATESSAQKLNTAGTKGTTMQATMPPLIFGSSKQETKLPEFNSSAQTPAVNPIPTFGAPSNSATPSLFGSSSTPAFGNTTTPVFGDTAATPAIFTFGSTSSQQPSSGGFNFSANTNPPASSAKPFFTFGSNSSTPQSNNNMFGSFGANTAATNAPNFAFNPPKQEAPTAFGQDATTPPMFGASQTNPQTQATSSFSSTASSSTGFNFGSTAPPAATSGGFNFGEMSSTSTPTGGFNFNPPTTAPAVAFDPNSRPSFNFTKGNVPAAFNAPPQPAPATSRKIKKAFRRCMR
ncbi:nuclear pore complex protein Nup153 isoform X2 [Linepithema humile]|uniref:nuclear pore complex protein Nup153 isoform X2 n=1 Tax=Linepithema humile TaxID=83485 RepID=UPI00062376C3|nr:PREDICTED: nuclear pore complex protein Nup153 isoform X2 [Linepithema humile]